MLTHHQDKLGMAPKTQLGRHQEGCFLVWIDYPNDGLSTGQKIGRQSAASQPRVGSALKTKPQPAAAQ